MTVKVIGSLSDTKAISPSESSIKSLAVEAIASHSDATSFLSSPFHSLSVIYTDDIAPPGAEIYIRIGSLLI